MSGVIAWRVPPTVRRGRPTNEALRALQEELKSRPGEWAYIGIRKSSSYAASIRGGKGTWGPKFTYDARAVRSEDGEDFDIYVRFIGLAATS